MSRLYSIFEAKAKLSEVIRLVKRKHRVTITDRGKPVALVIPYSQDSSSLEERTKQLEQSGELTKSKIGPGTIRAIAARPGALKRFLESRE